MTPARNDRTLGDIDREPSKVAKRGVAQKPAKGLKSNGGTARERYQADSGGDGSSRRRSLKTSEVIARELADEIVKRDLAPGTALPPERDMIERYGVGRTTLREALRILETRGVLTIRVGPGGGPVVRRPRATDMGDALTLILQFEGASLWDVFQAHRAMLPMIASLAAAKITARETAELAQSVQRMQSAVGDDHLFDMESERFANVITNAAGSATLRVLADAVRFISRSTIPDLPYFPAEQQVANIQHSERLLDALQRRDAEAAEQEMRTYLDDMGRQWTQRYRALVNRPVRWMS